ncbi:MAG TPA: DNA polymerase III subunit gamma/tau, partial [Verrucomicrobiae bacterium]|nr:DNA polymerase III subunit gamma/tau [Verrucomicrobiae bacterium]
LDEVIGQEHITETLKRAIKSGRVSHAYLFTGPRGVGKTSIARILAHELNEVAYEGEDAHLDIIEIDAASNGGVDEIRDLRDKIYIAPANGKYKVYIIDEVHMMTTSAFNALLKTLEEPPAHAIFILATTEAHKLPATIISRTQRFTFKPIAHDKMVKHLRTIADTEKIAIDDEALDLIAELSDGGFRDAIGMLDQASGSAKKIDRAAIEALLGIPTEASTTQILDLIQAHDASSLAAQLAELRANGFQASAVAKQLAQHLRSGLLAGKPALEPINLLTLLDRLVDVPASHNADQLLEIVLLEAALRGAAAPMPEAAPSVSIAPPAPIPAPMPPSEHKPAQKPSEPAAGAEADTPSSNKLIDLNTWQALLESLKKQYNTLYGVIRMAHAEFTPGHVTLTFGFVFHQKRANDPKNKKIVTSTLEEITGDRIIVDCKYDKTATPLTPTPSTSAELNAANPALGTVAAVFGGGEVLQ